MAFQKGRSGNPGGEWKEKPFRDALRLEIAAAGPNHKALRRIARRLLEDAEGGNIQAIAMVADRLDGKPAQEATVTLDVKRATELTDDELADIASRGGKPSVAAKGDPKVTH